MQRIRRTALYELALTLGVLLILTVTGCAQGGAQLDAKRNGIDTRLTGAWLLLKQSNVPPSGFVPPSIHAVYIHDDGRMEGMGVHAATGELCPGYPLHWSLGGRVILWADSISLQFTQQDVQTKEPELCEGRWHVDENVLRLNLRNSCFGRWTEVYVRVSLGDSVALPRRVQADILIDGKPLPLVAVSSTSPGSVNFMQLDTATHITIHFEGKTAEGLRVRFNVRVHDINGPGVYSAEVEPGSCGSMITTDEETGPKMKSSRVTAGTVTIEELNLETLRCRGTIELLYEQKLPGNSRLHVTGSFDLPIWLSNEYDVKIYRITRPADRLEVEVP